MKVYLLINDFAFDGKQDSDIQVFDTREKAEKQLRKDFEAYKYEYLEDFDEDELYIEEPTIYGAIICPQDNYGDRHDSLTIVEKEVL